MSQTMLSTAPVRAGNKDDVIDRLFHPACHYGHPRDVLADATLSLAEKRAVLSSWASDACAIASCPSLRHPPFAARAVSFDEVMDALVELDRAPEDSSCQKAAVHSGEHEFGNRAI
ncbi:hypothetical protein AB6806_20910 [Bosea sp. RCC_152_1]|uniref:hypothetical protein n=1 Tax=Bosea sp. RCC_152_1 TaxID=3239228 RepID=UPI0035231CAD